VAPSAELQLFVEILKAGSIVPSKTQRLSSMAIKRKDFGWQQGFPYEVENPYAFKE